MGYASEKKEVERNKKRLKWIGVVLIGVCIVFACVLRAFLSSETWIYYLNTPKTGKRGEGELRIHFIDVGQGDATLIELPDGKLALIDGGNGTSASNTALLRHLNALDADTVDYLFLTHADEDHYGGLTAVLEHKNVLRAFLPETPKTPTASYERFYAKLLQEGCPYFTACPPNAEHPEMKLSVSEGAYPYALTVVYPYIQNAEDGDTAKTDDNASSVVIWLDYMGTSALFTGDAPKSVEERLMRDGALGLHARYGVELTSTEILKVAHHGSNDSTGAAFLEFLHLQTAVVSCGEDNDYGHPSEEALINLRNAGAEIFRTDEDGSVIVTATKEGAYTVKALGK
ncbi:MAG: MBL fold metallo-hydrolase [Clostridia bacterium]|nr:MBL fold metallo-hydrolase [Clostridia bacterium]